MSEIFQHEFKNGLRMAAEPIMGARSLSMTMLLPAGITAEPPDKLGVATMLAELMCRGAGGLDARAHSDALDQLGVQRGTSVESSHLRLGATMLHDKLPEAIGLLFDMFRKPMLPESALEPTRDLALQDIESLEDEPQQKAFIALRKRHYPHPLNRSPLGEADHIESMTHGDIRQFAASTFVPGHALLGFAGHFDWDDLREQVEQQIEGWQGSFEPPAPEEHGQGGYEHLHADSTQLHIGIAYDALPEKDPDSILQAALAAVLSGGMSGRLFTEVREKRGLCYSVFASYAGGRDLGAMLSYAGTTAPRAQETFDVLSGELRRVSEGVDKSEFERAIVGMKSRLVMQGESSSSRAYAIAADQYVYGRPRTLAERTGEVDSVTLDSLNDFGRRHLPEKMTVVSIGPEPLRVESPAEA